MKQDLNCPIITNEKFSKEVLSDMVTSLEKLESIKVTIFNRLNAGFQERVTKLCNIKARIIRANQIIASYASIKDAITLKSKYYYPIQKHNYYIPTVIDKNATKIIPEQIPKINKKVINDKNNLGVKSTAGKDKMNLYDNYLSFATQFNDIVNELDKVYKQESNLKQTLDEVEPILNHVTSEFTFGTKMKIEYARKTQYNPIEINQNRSQFLQDIEKEKKEVEERRKKTIQQAPISITKKVRIRKYRNRGKKLKTKKNSATIEFNLPSNINLGGVSNFNIKEEEEDKNEDKEDEEEEEDDDFIDDNQNENQIEDDTNMPMDFISYNKQKSGAVKNNNITPVNNNTSTNNNINNNTNTNTNTNNVTNNPSENKNNSLIYFNYYIYIF